MPRNIGEGQVFRAHKVDRWAFVQSIVFFTHESCIFDSLMAYVVYVLIIEIKALVKLPLETRNFCLPFLCRLCRHSL